jgi:hypothetical protein
MKCIRFEYICGAAAKSYGMKILIQWHFPMPTSALQLIRAGLKCVMRFFIQPFT